MTSNKGPEDGISNYEILLNEGFQTNQGILDFSTEMGRATYKNMTKQVQPKGEPLFSCDSEGLFQFLEDVKRRAMEYKWGAQGGILDIPSLNPAENGVTRNLIDVYGAIAIDEIAAHDNSYMTLADRRAQDNAALFSCLMNSISKVGKEKVALRAKDYSSGREPSGPLLLKVIISESHLDTSATILTIRTNLHKLHEYLPSVGHDIVKFNRYVEHQVLALRARGHHSTDLVVNLFEAYKTSSDKNFVDYIRKKEDDWMEGRPMEVEQLMNSAKHKYLLLVQAKKWNAPSPEEAKLMALQSKIEQVEKQAKNARKDRQDTSNNTNKNNKGKGGSNKNKNTKNWKIGYVFQLEQDVI